MRTLVRGLVAATALSLAPLTAVVATTAPAAAATTVNTVTAFEADVKTSGYYGDTFIVSGTVTPTNDPDGSTVLAGTSYLQRLIPGSSNWENVASDTSPGFSYFPSYDKFRGNASFRIYYTGGTYGTPGSSSERVYPASVSPVLKVGTARNITFKDPSKRSPRARVKVSPEFGGKKVLVQVKKGKRYKTVKKVRTNKNGRAIITVRGNSRGIKYRVVAPSTKNYISSSYSFKAYSY